MDFNALDLPRAADMSPPRAAGQEPGLHGPGLRASGVRKRQSRKPKRLPPPPSASPPYIPHGVNGTIGVVTQDDSATDRACHFVPALGVGGAVSRSLWGCRIDRWHFVDSPRGFPWLRQFCNARFRRPSPRQRTQKIHAFQTCHIGSRRSPRAGFPPTRSLHRKPSRGVAFLH